MAELNEHIDCVLGKLPNQIETGCREVEEALAVGESTDPYCWCCSADLADYPDYLNNIVADQTQLLEDLWN